jgi:hypothetical protein
LGDISREVIREPGSQDARAYQRRVYWLAAAYLGLFAGSLAGLAIVVWQGQHLVTLSQRSNVETLTLGFLLVFFAYLGTLSLPGALGTARIAAFRLRRWRGDPLDVERAKHRALGPSTGRVPPAALNVLLEREAAPGQPVVFDVGDEAGLIARLEIRGAEILDRAQRKNGSHSLAAYFVQQVQRVLDERGAETDVDVVEWGKIDDEATHEYVALTHFAWRLEQHLDASELWPKVVLTGADCARIQEALTAVCPALRNESFLPDW